MPEDSSAHVVRLSQSGSGYEVHNAERYGGGLACLYRTFDTMAEAEAWIDGYETGARENM